MRVTVEFQDESLEFELPAERVVASWRGPVGLNRSEQFQAIEDALENPSEYPPLRQQVVSGDRVVIALDRTIGAAQPLLQAVGQALTGSGVDSESVTVLSPQDVNGALRSALPSGVSLVVHDPDARDQLAYLASTKQGRRIYLNRLLTDADVVVPVGRLGYDPILGYRGPWSILYPELSDRATIAAHRGALSNETGSQAKAARSKLDESFEVSWLLGSQFQLGLVPATDGFVEAIAGRERSVHDRAIASLKRHWRFRAESRAELVVVGIGRPGAGATLESLGEGLLTATRLVQRGGKIVLLSRACGEIGPALRCLIGAETPRGLAATLRGREADHDFVVARRVVQALAWADVYLLSGLDPQLADDLSLVALENPAQARRLVAQSGSCLFVSHGELTHAEVQGEEL
jgi:nickel-dependent lactate racemase